MYEFNKDQIEKRLTRDIDIIVDRIVTELRNKPDAIYLVGGYGRGEGSWFEGKDGEPCPYNDYDIAVISNEVFGYEKLQAIRRSLAKQVSINWVDIDFYTHAHLQRLTATIHNIDLLHASRLVYGHDILKQYDKLNAADIGIDDLDKLYRTRMWTLLGSWHGAFHSLNAEEARFFKNQMAKCVLAACDMILIEKHDYVTSYCERATRAPLYYKHKTGFGELANWALREKLRPTNTTLSKLDMEKLYFKVKDLFMWAFQQSMNSNSNFYLDPYLTSNLKCSNLRLKLIYFLYTYILRNPIIKKGNDIFYAQNFVLHANKNGTINQNMLKEAAILLKKWGYQFNEVTWDELHNVVADARNNI